MRRRGYERGRKTRNKKREGRKKKQGRRRNGEKDDAMRVSSCGRRCHPAKSGDTLNITACYADSVEPFPLAQDPSPILPSLSHKLSSSPNKTIISPSRLIRNLTFSSQKTNKIVRFATQEIICKIIFNL